MLPVIIELHGHRGARGLRPENTLPAFAAALSIGVDVLEFDVGVSADGVVVVAHDRRLNPDITRDGNGEWLGRDAPCLHALSYAQIRRYDVGRINPDSEYAREFPAQVPCDGAHMPSLAEVVGLVRRASNERVRFNIEVKMTPEEPRATLAPDAFAQVLAGELSRLGVIGRCIVQSFDWRVLQHVQALVPGLATAYLSSRQSWLNNLAPDATGCSPWTAGFDIHRHGDCIASAIKAAGGATWSSNHVEMDAEQVARCHELGLQVLVWTVNEVQDMREMIALGVDGIVSDYPDRLRDVLQGCGLRTPRSTPVDP